MLIQNVTNNPAPAPIASHGNDGSPVVAVSAQTGNTKVEFQQPAATPVAGTQPAQPADAHAAQPTNAQIQSAVDKANQAMQQANTGVEFSIDTDSKRSLIKVVDSKTGETIKQFPSKEMIAISQSIDQFQKSLLLRQKA
jgi:flagellar protein FlaG